MSTPPGWYPDPYGHAQLRWWDGATWTGTVSTNGQQYDDPAGGGAAPSAEQPSMPSGGQPVMPPLATGPARRSWSPSTLLAVVGVAALLVGGIVGYVVRGDGGKGSSGPTTVPSGSTSAPTTTTPGSGGSLAQPILRGLASLDAYEWQLTSTSKGPGPTESSTMTGSGSSDSASDSSYQKLLNTSVSAEGESSDSTTETWRVGDQVCHHYPDSDPEYETDTRNPFELDLSGTLPGVFDLVVATDNAQLVGTEQLAGVAVRHYTFTVEGLGAGSGSQVTANSGEIWVAEDGGYVVKYHVDVAMRNAPEGTAEAEVVELSVTLELTSINQPVPVTLPAGCPPPA